MSRDMKGKRVIVTGPTSGVGWEIALQLAELYRNATPDLVQRLTRISGGRTSADGADTTVWLASGPDPEGVMNKFFEDREERDCEFRNVEAEEKLWRICEGLVNRNQPA